MIRIITGSRLHFGLFSLPGRQFGAQSRQFGGVGLMVEQPGLSVSVRPANGYWVSGHLQERARLLASQVVAACGIRGAFDIQVESCPAEHMGLGTGTQLGLAIALALTRAAGQDSVNLFDLAQHLGRGRRSAIGIHGFLHGGFLVEAGKAPATAVAPLVVRADFPESWRVLVMLPPGKPGCHGQPETRAFADLARLDAEESERDALCRLTLLGMLPAIHESDLPAFGEALYEFNRRVGEMFRPFQGDIYSHAVTTELVGFLRKQAVHGVGQSSWGPAVFAVTEAARAEDVARLVRDRFGLQDNQVIITRARNEGACCRIMPDDIN